MGPSIQNTLRIAPASSPSQHLRRPPSQLIQPTTCDNHARDNIHQPHQQCQKTASLFTHEQQYRLNIVFKEDSRRVVRAFGQRVRLTSRRILIRKDCVARFLERFGWIGGVLFDSIVSLCVDRGNDVKKVLEFVVVCFSGCDCFVEWVEDGWVVRAEGELGDHVGEVEIIVLYQSV